MTFRTFSRRVTAIALATAAAATMSVGAAQSASAANVPDSGIGANGVGDGPVGPSGCRGDCGAFGNPNPNHHKPKAKPCGGAGQASCEPHPGCSGGVCLPPPPPGGSHAGGGQCGLDGNVPCSDGSGAPVLPGSHTSCDGGFIQLGPVTGVYDPVTGAMTRCDAPPPPVNVCTGAVDCVLPPICDTNPNDPVCLPPVDPGAADQGVVDPGAADQGVVDPGAANVDNGAVDNGAVDPGAADVVGP